MDVRSASILGPSAVFKGEFTFEGDARIQGVVEGTISSKGEVRVDQGGFVKGNIHAATISVDGRVEGDLVATEKLELLANADVRGDLVTRSLVVAQGAAFVGHVNVGPEANTQPKPERAGLKGRPTRAKMDPDWLPEVPGTAPHSSPMTTPLTAVTSPASRIPEWQGVATRPAWMTGIDGKVE